MGVYLKSIGTAIRGLIEMHDINLLNGFYKQEELQGL